MLGYDKLLSPREVMIGGKGFTVSKIPALKAQEIYCRIMKESNGYGNLGYTMLKTETIKELLSYAAVKNDAGGWTLLDLEDIINSYCIDTNTLNTLVLEMIQENYGFLFDSTLLKQLGALDKVEEEAE